MLVDVVPQVKPLSLICLLKEVVLEALTFDLNLKLKSV